MATDEQLVASYVESGDSRFFDELTLRYIRKVWSLTFQMVDSDADADDLTQEVFLRVIRSIHQFDSKSRFSTWLYRIAMNSTYTFLDKRKRHLRQSHSDFADTEDDQNIEPARAAEGAELFGRIEEAIESLSPKLRAAIVLTTLHGYSAADASEIEGCPEGTMYWRLHEARGQLRKRLRKHL